MYERIFTLLWQLYPPSFRDAYRDEALQLLRDRVNAERGHVATLRLWIDLLADFAVSLPLAHSKEASLHPAAAHADGMPGFEVLDDYRPRRSVFMIGGVLSLAMLAIFPSAVRALRDHPAPIARIGGLGIFEPLQQEPQKSAGKKPAAQDVNGVTAEDRHRVITEIIDALNKNYAYPDVAKKIGAALLQHEQDGDYSGAINGDVFAGLLTDHMRASGNDLHLSVVYSGRGLPQPGTAQSPERREAYRKALERENCTFSKVEVLPHNIGYFKLDSFPDPEFCEKAATSAMQTLNGTSAVIFDLRDNRGGYPAMVMLLASHLFDRPQFMYRPEGRVDDFTKPVAGSKLTDKPVYVLTSSHSFSGAEHFTYDLKMLKRATVVGEKTAGAPDVAVFHRLEDHFGVAIRESKIVNPYPEPDWAVVGVEPNVSVPAADALDIARKLATERIEKTSARR